jgi:hypothetical protein
MPVLVAAIIISLVAMRTVSQNRKAHLEAVKVMVERGVYDPRLLPPPSSAALGWGLVLGFAGIAMLLGFLIQGNSGGLITAFVFVSVGVALMVLHLLVRRDARKAFRNGEPPALLQARGDRGRDPTAGEEGLD